MTQPAIRAARANHYCRLHHAGSDGYGAAYGATGLVSALINA
ncbi:MAG: hypothetical protein OXC14_01180 [Rhodospirillaceae bacterium]|nr:hypothetical protein [Rhodospirillaceae bacterium]